MAKKQNQTPLIIVGTDAEARVAHEIATSIDVLVYGYVTDSAKEHFGDVNDATVHAVLGTPDSDALLKDENTEVVVATHDIAKRRSLVREVKMVREAPMATLLHRHTAVSPYAKLGQGVLVYGFSLISPNVQVGDFVLIGANVSVEPDAQIGDFCNIRSGVRIGRGAIIQDEVYIGMGAIIQSGVKIGGGATIAPGAVVLKNVEEGTTVFGNPAQKRQ